MKRKGWTAALTAVFLLALALQNLCRTTVNTARSEDTYASCFAAYADTSASFVSRDAYPALAKALAGYLSGRVQTPQVTVEKNGVPAQAYSDKELTHLSDVKTLFDRLVIIQYAALALCAVSALFLFLIIRAKRGFLDEKARETWEKKNLWPGALIGAGVAFAVLAGLTAWGALNFDGLFITLHKLFFSNNLWLLNPNTDLLIQLMPTRMFVHLGLAIVKSAAVTPLILLLLIAAGSAALMRTDKKAQKNTDGNRTD